MSSTPIDIHRSMGRSRPEALTGFEVGAPFGVPVRVDWSLLIVFALIVYNLGALVFPAWHPGWTAAASWTLAVLAAGLFFGSVVVHELAHALAARRFGVATESVTLFLFGGLADIKEHPPTPGAEFVIAATGPLASLLIGAACGGAALLLAGDPNGLMLGDAVTLDAYLRTAGPLGTLLLWLGGVNLVLAAFNLVPAFPLDGGRIFRALVWSVSGDYVQATRWATTGGRVFGWALMAVGVMEIFAGAWVEGGWLLLLGWFLNNAAQISFLDDVLRQLLRDVPIAHVMQTNYESVAPDLPLDFFVREHLFVGDQAVFPVILDGRFEGLVSAHEVRSVAPARWPHVTVGQVMLSRDTLPTLGAGRTAESAYDALARLDREEIAVAEGHTLLGLVHRADLLKWLTLYERFPRRRVAMPGYRAGAPAH